MAVSEFLFQSPKDTIAVYKYTIENKDGNKVSLLNYGAIIHSIVLHDKNGKETDIVLGFDSIQDYIAAGGFIGATVGRCANRIHNARFDLNGKRFELFANEGLNSLHGGKTGFSKKIWKLNRLYDDGLEFSYASPAGEENYPGNLFVTVEYRFTDENLLKMTYRYTSDADTVVNLTNHSYFNLAGTAAQNGLDQKLLINADFYTPVDERGLITGEIISCRKTCFDFSSFSSIKEKYDNSQQLVYTNGFDHNMVLNSYCNPLADNLAKKNISASLYSEQTGLRMDMYTDYPGLQLYSGNYLRQTTGKYGHAYGKHSGICFEPQFYPNAIHINHFPSPIAKKGETYTFDTRYQFSLE